MKVVVVLEQIRGQTVTFEELEELWKTRLAAIPAVTEYTVIKEEELTGEMLKDATAVLGMKLKKGSLSDDFSTRFPKLKYVATFNHGVGEYDREACKRNGVTVRNTIYGAYTIAQFAMALLLTVCHGIAENSRYYKEEHFALKEESGRNPAPLNRQMELYGKTLGIIGLGNIGLRMAQMAAAFGMRVISYSPHKKEGKEYEFITQVSLDEVLKKSDVISLHCALTAETRGMINSQAISRMKDNVILINTARGELIEEEDFIKALNERKIYGAGLDVVCGEPLAEKSEIFYCPYVYITPHMAWLCREAVFRQVDTAAENLKRWLEEK